MNVVPAQVCGVCRSPDTIRTSQARDRDSWYCYRCRRGFEVLHDTSVDADDRRPTPTAMWGRQ